MRNVTALVLAGGITHGYSVLTHNRAKSALPFCGHFRIIDFPLSNLSLSGINNVGVIIQYLPGSLIDHIGVGRAYDLDTTNRRIKLMPPFVGMGKTEWFRGTAEAVYQNLNFVRDTHAELVLILSGDHVFSMDFAPLVEFHRERNADLTIATAPRPKGVPPSTFGYVTSDPNSRRVTGFYEKPEVPPNDTISIGIYLFDAKLLCDWLENLQDQSSSHNLPTDVIEPLVHQSLVYAYPFEDDWHYLADLESYVAVHRRMLVEGSKNILRQNRVMTNLRDRELGSRPSPFFGSQSDVQDSLISPGCHVEGTVIRSVLSPGVYVAPNAMITDSILFHDCKVHEGARLHRVVSDKDAVFHPHCQVGTHDSTQCPVKGGLTVVGKGAEIMQGVRVDSGVELEIDQVVKRDLENMLTKNSQLATEAVKKG